MWAVDWLTGIGSMSPWNSSTGPVAAAARASLLAASQRACCEVAVLQDLGSNRVGATVAPREIAIGPLQAIAAQVGETRETAAEPATRVQIVGVETASVIGAPLAEVDLETRVPSAAVRGDLAGAVRVPAVRAAHRA